MDCLRTVVAGWGLVVLSAVPAAAQVPPRTIDGRAVTGINRVLGEPVFDFGAPFGTIGFDTVAAYNPGGAELPLTPSSPAGTLLATTVDPLFLEVFGLPPDSYDPALRNIPLRDVAAMVAPDGARAPLRDHLDAGQLEPSRAISSGPLTLGKWLAARGQARFRCTGAGAPRVDLSFTGLVPNGLYTVWGGMLTAQGPAPVPLGGVPNLFVAEEDGRGRYSRRLNYCPFDLRPGEVPLAFIDVVLHTDHMVYAGVPEPFAAGLPPGLVSQIHVEFAVSATPVE